jgi:hypothetical protein
MQLQKLTMRCIIQDLNPVEHFMSNSQALQKNQLNFNLLMLRSQSNKESKLNLLTKYTTKLFLNNKATTWID